MQATEYLKNLDPEQLPRVESEPAAMEFATIAANRGWLDIRRLKPLAGLRLVGAVKSVVVRSITTAGFHARRAFHKLPPFRGPLRS
ncbi:MAG: hypothetical protein EOO22_10545 [Comamonadaceae bacterium]|nr:MAG: hypothetical protein EOO22_10545 [Comamonadaceae bacterium]